MSSQFLSLLDLETVGDFPVCLTFLGVSPAPLELAVTYSVDIYHSNVQVNYDVKMIRLFVLNLPPEIQLRPRFWLRWKGKIGASEKR